jgi:uncharacterized protein YdaL
VQTLGARPKKIAHLLAIAAIALLTCLVTASGAGAGDKEKKPPKPPKDIPSVAGLSGSDISSTSDSTKGNGKGTGGSSSSGNVAPGAIGSTTLVLYDNSGAYGWLGELYATYAGNLASHFGNWKAEPVASYQAGQISQYTATVYIGSTYDEPLSTAFLDDVYNSTHPVVWIYDNIWQLTNRYPGFQAKYGWMWSQFDLSSVSSVSYKGVTLSRDAVNNGAGIMGYGAVDSTKATTLASAVRSDGSTFPWALRSGTLTYIGEIPFAYTGETDRVIAFDDLLYDALNPFAQVRHRALVRLEDIGPSYDPAQLKAVADYLYSQGIPYGFGVSPVYTDPLGSYTGGTPELSKLSDRNSEVASTVKYMQAHGGTLIMHGYTHQYSNVINPYTAVSGDDFEFYRVTENIDHSLNFLGPVAEDSLRWATDRINSSFSEFKRAGISAPTIFEFPHYAGSAVDYQAVAQQFSTRWEGSMYYGGFLSGGSIDYSHVIGQRFPYVVRDVYGTAVLPEDAGSYAPEAFYGFKPHTVADILAAADAESAVRDGFASFYYHPFEGVAALQQIVTGLKARGWSFVSPTTVAATG